MGLDMYLHCNSKILSKELVQEKGDWADLLRMSGIVAYWRKANAIHRWFVENVQGGNDDCKMYEVEPEQLFELWMAVNTVLQDETKAEELLPTQDGFFFGNTEYDEWYWDDLKQTSDILGKILARIQKCGWHYVVPEEPDWYLTFWYQSSW